MCTLRHEVVAGISQIKRRMNAGAEGRVWRNGNKSREWRSGVDCPLDIPGSDPGFTV